jgi:hypothetical protein
MVRAGEFVVITNVRLGTRLRNSLAAPVSNQKKPREAGQFK